MMQKPQQENQKVIDQKNKNKDDLLQKVNCEKCDKVIRLQNKKYTQKRFVRKK